MLPGLNLPLVPIGSAAAVPTVENISLDTIKSRFIADSPSMYLSTQYQYTYDGSTTNISDGGSDMFDGAATLNLTPSAGPSFSTIPFDTHDKTNSVQYGRTATGYWPNLLYALLPANFSTTIGETGNYGADSSGSIVTNNSVSVVYSGFTYTWTAVHVYGAIDPSIGWLCFSIATGSVSLPAITASYSASTDTPYPTWTIPTFTGKRIVGLMLLSKFGGAQITVSEFDTAVKTFIDRVIYGRKTLAQFTAHINALTSNSVAGSAGFGGAVTGKYRVSNLSTTFGTLWGTSWGSVFTNDSNSSKAVWHGLPSQATFDAIIANGGAVVADITSIGSYTAGYTALARNGLTSSSYGTFDGLRMNSLIYWDYATGYAKIVYPNTQTGPVDYIF